MNKFLKALVSIAVLLAGNIAFAQFVGGTCQSVYINGMQTWQCPPGVGMGGTYPYAVPQVIYNGVPQQYYGGGMPQVINQGGYGFSTPTIVGGVLGGTIGSLAKHHTGQAVIGGTILGGIVGSLFSPSSGQRVIAQPVMQQPMVQTIGQPMIVQQPQQVVVAQPVSVPTQVAQPAPVQAGGSGTFCNIDGVVTREANGAACEAKAAEKAKNLVSGKGLDVKHQDQAPTCAQGKTWDRLNWPGHHQHGTYVCLPDGDPHRFSKETTY